MLKSFVSAAVSVVFWTACVGNGDDDLVDPTGNWALTGTFGSGTCGVEVGTTFTETWTVTRTADDQYTLTTSDTTGLRSIDGTVLCDGDGCDSSALFTYDVAFDDAQGTAIISTEQLLLYIARTSSLRPARIILVGEAGVDHSLPGVSITLNILGRFAQVGQQRLGRGQVSRTNQIACDPAHGMAAAPFISDQLRHGEGAFNVSRIY